MVPGAGGQYGLDHSSSRSQVIPSERSAPSFFLSRQVAELTIKLWAATNCDCIRPVASHLQRCTRCCPPGDRRNKESGLSKCQLADVHEFPLLQDHCPTQGCVDFRNITLRRVTVDKPWLSPGVILGNASNPMQGIVFEEVNVTDPGAYVCHQRSCSLSRISMCCGDACHTLGFTMSRSLPPPFPLSLPMPRSYPYKGQYLCEAAQVTVINSSPALPANCRS